MPDLQLLKTPRVTPEQILLDNICLRLLAMLRHDLRGLSTAQKNRVLLTVAEHIGQQLEALETATHD
jgi:hypothetical protein